jgi:hypothetical protein
LEQFSAPPAPVESTARGFVKPADYYSSPPEQRGRGIPPSLQMGCGLAGLGFMALLFVGANFVSTEGAGKFLGMLFGRLKGELVGMTSGDVSPEQKAALERQMEILIQRTERNELNLVRVQPLLKQMNEFVRDQKLTASEVAQLTTLLEQLNAPVPQQSGTR